MIDPALQLTAVVLLSLVFGVAAISKMAAWSELPGVVQNYQLLPVALVPVASALLPPVELLVAIGLLLRATRAPAAIVAMLLLLVFAVAIGINVKRGRTSIDCGCFRSALKQPISWWLVLRNTVLGAFAVLCMVDTNSRALAAADYVTILCGGATLFLIYLCAGYASLPPPPRFDEQVAARANAQA